MASENPSTNRPARAEDPFVLAEASPIRRSIPWIPAVEGVAAPAAVAYPVFVSQRTLLTLQTLGAGFSFLVGRVGSDPDTGAPFVVVRDVIVPQQPVLGDRPAPLVSRALKLITEDLPADGTCVLGWHRTHSVHGTMMTLADLEMHRQFFSQPWQVALVTGFRDGQPAGYFYRPQEDPGPVKPLAFYELLDESPTGPLPNSCLSWVGYRTTDPRVAPPRPRPSGPIAGMPVPAQMVRPSGSPVLLPVYDRDPDDPAWSGRVGRAPRVPAVVPYVAVAVIAAAATLGLSRLFAPEPEVVVLPTVPITTPAEDSLAAAAMELERALRAYGEKQGLFDARMMVCDDLAAALVEVEGRFVAFAALKGAVASAASNSRHESLVASVDSVDGHYERSRCARP